MEGQVTVKPYCLSWAKFGPLTRVSPIMEGHVTLHLPDYKRTLQKALLVSLLSQVRLRHFPIDLLKIVVL